jgi:hypothetical protein
MLARMEPLVWGPDTELLVATDSEWTAYFNNGTYGTELSGRGRLT